MENTFTKLGNGPVLSYSPDEPFVLGSPKIRRFNNVMVFMVFGWEKMDKDQRPNRNLFIKSAWHLIVMELIG